MLIPQHFSSKSIGQFLIETGMKKTHKKHLHLEHHAQTHSQNLNTTKTMHVRILILSSFERALKSNPQSRY